MKNKLIFFLLIFLPAGFASANGIIPCSGKDCTICHLFQVAQILFNGFIKFALVYIALFLIIWAGILIMTDAGNNKNKLAGINLLKKTLIGIVIMLTSWAIINTLILIIAPKAIGPSGEPLSKSWYKIECSPSASSNSINLSEKEKNQLIKDSSRSDGSGGGGGFVDDGGEGGGGSGGGFW